MHVRLILFTMRPMENQLNAAREVPILWLGVAGFSADEREFLRLVSQRASGPFDWRFCSFQDADAWLINGARVRSIDADVIRVAPGMPTEWTIRLGLADVNRPISFATPLPEGFFPRSTFDVSQPVTLVRTLTEFSRWLQPLRTQFELGREIVRRGNTLRHGVFHVVGAGRLLAVLNFRTGRAALAPEPAADMGDAEWVHRPPGAGETPPGFVTSSVSQLSWVYVRHSACHVLPDRYLEGPVYFRGPPRVPVQWISDAQLTLLRELQAEPATLQELRARTAMPLEQIQRDLACLFFAAAITSSPSKAAQRTRPVNPSMASTGAEVADLMRATEAPADDARLQVPLGLTRQFHTVPAPLLCG